MYLLSRFTYDGWADGVLIEQVPEATQSEDGIPPVLTVPFPLTPVTCHCNNKEVKSLNGLFGKFTLTAK